MIYITEVHMNDHEPGTEHGHIHRLRWRNVQTSENGESTREELVDWIRNRGIDIHVEDSEGHDVAVGVVNTNPPHLRTHRDNKEWTDNLLVLPRY
jgi:hypothetical protein